MRSRSTGVIGLPSKTTSWFSKEDIKKLSQVIMDVEKQFRETHTTHRSDQSNRGFPLDRGDRTAPSDHAFRTDRVVYRLDPRTSKMELRPVPRPTPKEDLSPTVQVHPNQLCPKRKLKDPCLREMSERKDHHRVEHGGKVISTVVRTRDDYGSTISFSLTRWTGKDASGSVSSFVRTWFRTYAGPDGKQHGRYRQHDRMGRYDQHGPMGKPQLYCSE
ncbi:hypothetical protein F2Q70_00025831 [Brassica cretica]|uniref:Uncharacterized protein n=1 Tax=Brassica cretica TaxID=69181 RepID=A0A8S9L756_BRACR|nr:hypothetical protein F2Q70_00025831 [Brassica cretica]